MAWLVAGDRVLASAERATDRRARVRGLIGRERLEGVLVLEPCRSVHTFGVRFPIDVAFVDGDGVVLATRTLAPGRLTVPRWSSRCVIEARAGSFDRWNLRVGDQVEVRE